MSGWIALAAWVTTVLVFGGTVYSIKREFAQTGHVHIPIQLLGFELIFPTMATLITVEWWRARKLRDDDQRRLG